MRAAALALALAACAGLDALALRATAPRVSPAGVRLDPETAVQTAALLGLGMRRLAADLELVRLLVYYGTPESREQDEEQLHARFDPLHPERAYGGGTYPEMGPRGRRIAELDPTFSYAVEYAAGALAFNLNRADEALDLLRFALERDPDNVSYRAYIGAIGLSRTGDTRGAVALLEPVVGRPDCPTMIKSMVAFMYRRLGERRKAAALYSDIAETSRDAGYRSVAERALRELSSEPPKK